MTFRDKACAHLSDYRERTLGLPAGSFLYRGRDIPKGHILPRKYLRHNVLEPYRDRFFASKHGKIKLHQYFHHLNSSQALCINLLFPALAERQHSALINALGLRINSPFQPCFESESTVEIAKRRTSFDFHLKTQDEDVFVEVKYTEEGFGAASDDLEHRQKFVDTYAPLLKASPFLTRACRDCTFFLKNYQVLRNLVHITEKSQVVFLFPKANDVVAEQAAQARESFLTEQGKQRLHIRFLEDVVSTFIESCVAHPLRNHYEKVREKYLAFQN